MERGLNLSRHINSSHYSQKSVGLDPGFGSSAFGVCITELVDGQVNVLRADERLNGGRVAIDEHRHSKLIPALRTAVEKGDETLDKEATSHDDYLDAFRLSMQFWH